MLAAVFSTPSQTVSISTRVLHWYYYVIPVCLITVAIDLMVFGGQLRSVLPNTPANLVLWALIFNYPHIVSSIVTLADKEYLTYYRQRLLKGVVVIAVVLGLILYALPILLTPSQGASIVGLYIVFHAAYTMWHVLSQQYGVGMMLMRTGPTKTFQAWRWLSTIAGTLMYGATFNVVHLGDMTLMGMPALLLVKSLCFVLVAAAAIVGWQFLRQTGAKQNQSYTMLNILMLPATWVMLALDYNFFVIVIPRIIHDLTAFTIYMVHDHNRNAEVKHNVVYRWLSFLPLSPLLLCPIIAISIALAMECSAFALDAYLGFANIMPEKCSIDSTGFAGPDNGLPSSMKIWLAVSFSIGLFHYYLESFVRKRDAIHRHSVKFV